VTIRSRWRAPVGLVNLAGSLEPRIRSLPACRALREGAELVVTALHDAPFAVAVASAGAILCVNRRLAQWHTPPVDPEQLVGTSATAGDEPELAEAIAAAERGESRELSLSRLALLGGGKAAWRVHSLPLSIDGTRAVTLLIRDSSEETHAAEVFAASERRFRLLVDCANDGIAMHRDGVLLYANPAAVRILGFGSAQEIVGRPVMEFVHPDHRQLVSARIAQLAQGIAAPLLEETFLRKDGSSVEVEVSASRAPIEQGWANFVFFRDVSERKQLQAEVERAHRMDSLGRLAGGIAHDFNNLIASIQNALGLAGRGTDDPAAVSSALAQAEAATARAADLTRQLLTFSRGGEMVASAIDPNQVLTETLGLLGLAGDRIELELSLDPEVGKVWIDPSQLHQVVMNLLLNARDAVRKNGQIVVTTSRRRFDGAAAQSEARAGDWVVIAVSDSGSGMTPDTQTRIFEPFFTTKPSGAGTGLGLSTVYGVVRQAGGWVEVHSAVDRGTRFEVFLPAIGVTTVPPVSAERRQQKDQRQRVLVCDDEARLAALTAGLLEQHGYAAQTVTNGQEVIELLVAPEADYRAILLDVTLAGMGAPELLREIMAREIDVPVVLSSGYSEEDIPPELLQHPSVVGYLAKPYPVDRLIELIDRAVQSRPSSR
jgi:two-component system, cell cycle sensor histidine kinase and response regulator CckA